MKVATHSGRFHADDVFAVMMLRKIYPDIEIVRSRDTDDFAKADIRVDVGKKYDPSTGDFDHHQLEGAGKRENNIPYAAAGLIWKEFGMKLVKDKTAWDYIDETLMQPIDLGDNGIHAYKVTLAKPYIIKNTIETFNPVWKEGKDEDKAFLEAVDIAEKILDREIMQANIITDAEEIVLKALHESDGDILILDQNVPWDWAVVKHSKVKFVVFPNEWCAWYLFTVPVELGSFIRRKNLPEAWAALGQEELSKLTGVEDAVFCHRDLFIAGAKTKEGAIALARLALK